MERSHDLIGSWVIVDKATGKPVIELYNPANVVRVNTDRYQVYTAEEWLVYFNKQANGESIMKHSLSPYPASVRIKPICDGSQVFQHEQYKGTVEKRNNWGDDWLARPEHGIARYFPNKVEAVKYLLIDEE